MPVTIYPRNDEKRLTSGQSALNSNTNDAEKGKRYLMPQTANRLSAAVMKFEELIKTSETFISDRMKEVREKNDALTTLDMYIRHSWHSVKMRVERNGEPLEILKNYGLPLSGLLPNNSISPELTVTADKILTGNTKSVESGYPSMVNPTAEEMQAVNEIAKKELADVDPADAAVDEASAELAAIRSEIDQVLRDVVMDLNYNLRYEEEASRRRIMRRYGVEFRSDSAADIE